MEPTGAWGVIINQGPVFAIMAIIIYAGAQYIRSTLDEGRKREDEREKRYNALVDKLLTVQTEQVKAVTSALVANTNVMERVERKLDDHV